MADLDSQLIYSWWWRHDAGWYQGVARRFGFEVANEINKEALKFVAERVARNVAQKFDRPVSELEFEEAVKAFGECCSSMWPEEYLGYDYRITGSNSFEVNILRNFAIEMLKRAGTLDKYECPCLSLREGWFKGLGLKPAENRRVQCVLDGCDVCTLVATVPSFDREQEE